ncbi:hypothetical protein B0H17DRAFT_1128158 [Mycena rosella]|uniref:Uncharacterized protein n=1 Tax=Mycena rosella TaxID=1033263 RepID=A0AAD7DX97_MYCRO|nr:hypothetical protein B0H17DRAFT_1128158 [Mycena rosella]
MLPIPYPRPPTKVGVRYDQTYKPRDGAGGVKTSGWGVKTAYVWTRSVAGAQAPLLARKWRENRNGTGSSRAAVPGKLMMISPSCSLDAPRDRISRFPGSFPPPVDHSDDPGRRVGEFEEDSPRGGNCVRWCPQEGFAFVALPSRLCTCTVQPNMLNAPLCVEALPPEVLHGDPKALCPPPAGRPSDRTFQGDDLEMCMRDSRHADCLLEEIRRTRHLIGSILESLGGRISMPFDLSISLQYSRISVQTGEPICTPKQRQWPADTEAKLRWQWHMTWSMRRTRGSKD